MNATPAPAAGDEMKGLRERLAEPFDPGEVKFKVQAVKNNRAAAAAYVTARTVMDRLDEVVGVENWRDEYTPLPDGSVMCRLSLRIGGRWVSKSDVGSPSEQPDEGDRTKAAFSDALKRAAVKWAVGRYLYKLPATWRDYDPVKKQFVQVPQLPAWAVPKGKAPAQQQPAKPAAGRPQQQPARPAAPEPVRESEGRHTREEYDRLDARLKAVGWGWKDAMRWLAQTYPQHAARFTPQTRFQDVTADELGHLGRHLNTLSVRGK